MGMNNYEICRADWRKRILTLSSSDLLTRVPGLSLQGNRILVPYLNQNCILSLLDGSIAAPTFWGPLDLFDEMNIYTHLWYAQAGAQLSGEWVPFVQLKNASIFGPAFQKNTLQPFACTFTGHLEKLGQALQAMGGQKLSVGDVAYEIKVFPSIPMRIIFWEGDDEFPAQATLLFDRSAPSFIHVESVVTIASECLIHLAQIASLPLKSPAF